MQPLVQIKCSHLCPSYAATCASICSHVCPSYAANCAHHMQPLVPIKCSHLCQSNAATYANQMQPLVPIICCHLCPSNAATCARQMQSLVPIIFSHLCQVYAATCAHQMQPGASPGSVVTLLSPRGRSSGTYHSCGGARLLDVSSSRLPMLPPLCLLFPQSVRHPIGSPNALANRETGLTDLPADWQGGTLV
ncbi:hypothetical protein AB205_0029960 [Aquarana catesbeiana]|uniref:Uncharacterized protein n=1 Tax=Aquarana catesbeiana TaxID=8400 RepID=A0A2G9SKT7_AQUCT|nr:hypothetical protein AB205_0029960 [Aquarana catesbeiana]